eukprot:10284143-Lingulodinium_polyedra.AAC.1
MRQCEIVRDRARPRETTRGRARPRETARGRARPREGVQDALRPCQTAGASSAARLRGRDGRKG